MRKIIQTSKAPAAIGPYSQAVFHSGILYTSGQIAINAETGELDDENIEIETKRVLRNLQAVLDAADLTFSNVIKTTIFLKSMNDFEQVNAVYASFFTSVFPARETVEVAKLPKNVNVEISMIACKD
ncbi:MAG: Rid family detoxifying hydrolase [Crocinitomicaceae bacterium]